MFNQLKLKSMKTIKKERVSYYELYVANDGTEFNDKAECEAYDKTAKCAIFSAYNALVVKKTLEEDLFTSCGENRVEIVRINSEEDALAVLKAFFSVNTYLMSKSEDERAQNAEVCRAIEFIKRAKEEKDFLVIGRGYDFDSFWFYGTQKSIIEDFEKRLGGFTSENA